MARHILIATALLICWGSPAAARAAGCDTIPDAARISEAGAFSNVRYTAEHAYGYSVMLWRAGECLFGLFESSQGLAGDTPIGELRDVKYDRGTGRLSFSAKLTTGMVTFRGSNGEETSRDLFTFSGTLQAKSLTGVITYKLQNDPGFVPTRSDVVLKPSKTTAAFMKGSTTRGEWVRTWQPIIQRRGPKW